MPLKYLQVKTGETWKNVSSMSIVMNSVITTEHTHFLKCLTDSWGSTLEEFINYYSKFGHEFRLVEVV